MRDIEKLEELKELLSRYKQRLSPPDKETV
jgi:hypothetical protein